MSKKTLRDGKIRLYDGTGTPFYLEIDLDTADLNAPLGRAKQDELLILDRGKMSADAHYIKGPDDKIMEPIPVTFSAPVVDKTQCKYLIDWLDEMNNGDEASPPQSTNAINGNTLTSTKGDTQNDGSNNNPAFADGTKMTCNVEYKIDMTADIVMHYNEVYFPADQIPLQEGEDGIMLSLNGLCYGTIVRDTAFTAGTSIE